MDSILDLELEPLARLLKALADPMRLRLVALLAHGELCVCHLQEALGVPQSTASRQLAVLRSAGVIEPRRTQRWVYYRLARQSDPASAAQLASIVRSFRRSEPLKHEVRALTRALGPGACP